MPYSTQRGTDGAERYRIRKVDARLATIEDDLDSGVIGGGGGGGAPTGAAYVTIGSNATLTAERALTQGSGIVITDAGANSTVTISASGDAADLTSGTLPAARMPALTGDVTTTVGTVSTSIIAGAVTNAKLADVPTATFKGRTTAGTGDPEDLTATQATALLNLFSSTLKGLVPLSGGGTTNFLRADGTWAAPLGGGGGGANVGTATIDFGAFPGASHATVVVTGQAAIVAGSVVQAWIRPVATADHSADEHMLETLKVHAANIVAGIGFTVNAFNAGTINEPDVAAVSRDAVSQQAARPGGRGQQNAAGSDKGGKGTRIYGQWTIAWSWS